MYWEPGTIPDSPSGDHASARSRSPSRSESDHEETPEEYAARKEAERLRDLAERDEFDEDDDFDGEFVLPDDLTPTGAAALGRLEHLQTAEPVFAEVGRLRAALRDATGLALETLSLGMTGDMAAAIAAGSTCVPSASGASGVAGSWSAAWTSMRPPMTFLFARLRSFSITTGVSSRPFDSRSLASGVLTSRASTMPGRSSQGVSACCSAGEPFWSEPPVPGVFVSAMRARCAA